MFNNFFRCVLLLCLALSATTTVKAANYDGYLNKAIKLHKKHNYDAAISYYNKAINLAEQQRYSPKIELVYDEYTGEFIEEQYQEENNFSDLYFNRGLAKSEAGYAQEAMYDFNKSIQLDPQNDSAIFNRGIVEYELEMYREALRDFDRTIALVPGDAKALYNRAMTKYQLKDTRGALRDAKTSHKYYKELRKRKEAKEVADFIQQVKFERAY